MRTLFILVFNALILFMPGSDASAQRKIGDWTDHYNYRRARSLSIVNSRVYAASSNSIFTFDMADNSLSKITQINGLSDIDIVLVTSNPERSELLAAYSNGNLDILKQETVFNFAELKNSNVTGNKAIRHIAFYENRALLSTGIGILNLDLDRIEVSDTYTINDGAALQVNATAFYGDRIYAATNEGLFSASRSADLTIGANWQQEMGIPDPFENVEHIVASSDKLFINQPEADSPGIYYTLGDGNWTPTFTSADVRQMTNSPAGFVFTTGGYSELRGPDGISTSISFSGYASTWSSTTAITTDVQGNIWMSDGRLGLVKRRVDNGQFEFIAPDGPYSNRCFDLDFNKEGRLWLASGTPDRPGNWNNQFIIDGFASYSDRNWTLYSPENTPSLNDQLFYDACKVIAHPKKDNWAYVGSIFSGFAEVENGTLVNYTSTEGTTLQGRVEFQRPDNLPWVGTPGFAIDGEDNLWVTNPFVSMPLSVRKANDEWKSFTLTTPANDPFYQGLGTNKQLLDMIIDQQGQKWIIVQKGGIVVFDEGGTIDDISDDKVRLMIAESGRGGLPTNEVLAIVEDKDGEIWVATRSGLVVFYSPFDALATDYSDARQILVEQDGVYQYLFEGQTVTAIAVDGANRKWVGTFGSGVFLLSEDGTEELLNFNRLNSPLPSNNVNDIAINPKTGEVYFATTEGLISYQSDAIEPMGSNTCSSVYPNPVRENYTGPISITGLTRDAEVRITDARGNMIASMLSAGGKANWDGRNSNGVRVATGVYFAMVVDPEGESACTTKILVIK